jgi:hypothetical protein
MMSIPPWCVVCGRTNSIRDRTIAGEFDGAMNEIFRRGKLRVTGASQFCFAIINADDVKKPASR